MFALTIAVLVGIAVMLAAAAYADRRRARSIERDPSRLPDERDTGAP